MHTQKARQPICEVSNLSSPLTNHIISDIAADSEVDLQFGILLSDEVEPLSSIRTSHKIRGLVAPILISSLLSTNLSLLHYSPLSSSLRFFSTLLSSLLFPSFILFFSSASYCSTSPLTYLQTLLCTSI